MPIYRHILYIICLLTAICVRAEKTDSTNTPALMHEFKNVNRSSLYYIQGILRDSVTGEPLPYASVVAKGTSSGTLSDEDGIFSLTIPNSTKALQVTYVGYKTKVVPIEKNRVNMYAIDLAPEETMLKELVVRRKKYSKKNNPAVEFLQRLRSMADATDPLRNDYYNYDKYERINVALNDFAKKSETSWLFKKFPFLWEHVDTSEISGKPILNISFKEKYSKLHYRKSPKDMRENIEGINRAGLDEITDQESMQKFLNDILGEIDLYQNDITLLQNKFVSPLSRIAPDFYKFYLTDTVQVNDERCIVLSFYPHNNSMFGFVGQLYVPENDSTMFIKKVSMRLPRGINLNFIDNLYISQEFERAPDGSRLKTKDDLTLEVSIIKGTSGIYARRNVAYKNHNFDAPPNESEIFAGLQKVKPQENAENRNSEFWEEARLIEITDNEAGMSDFMTKLRSVPVFYWSEKILKILVSGYVQTGKNSKFDYGPVNTSISANTVEGVRLRVGGMTTANLSPHWFTRFYGAYGTKDHKWKYSAELEYSFNKKNYHSREFPVHSIKAVSLYDIDQIGQHYFFTNPDNVFLSLKRMPDTQVTYHHVNRLDYTLELHNNFSVYASLAHTRQNATMYMPFVNGKGESFGHYDEASFTLQLRYAPGEKFYQTKSHRLPINLDAPVFILSHTVAPKGLLGSKFTLNKTELSIQKRFWLSAFGYTDMIVKGGHIWSRTPYPDMLIPNANLSYTIQPESFALMNPMEFINDSYAMADITYWANGLIFNNIPVFKKLKLREVVGFKALFGHLSDKNDPTLNPVLFRFPENAHTNKLTNTPYMEISAGIENIFKCLRVDYVWRLSYLDVPYKIDRHGLRIALHFTF